MDDKLSRFRSLMKNKKQNIKQSQPRKVEDEQKIGERDVKQIMREHRDILQQERAARVQTESSLLENAEHEEEVPMEQVKPKVPKKKKEMKDENLVKMLYFKKYAGKSRSSLNERVDERNQKAQKGSQQTQEK